MPFELGQVLPVEDDLTLSGFRGVPPARLLGSQCLECDLVSTRYESRHIRYPLSPTTSRRKLAHCAGMSLDGGPSSA
jgi:hypothetical protein